MSCCPRTCPTWPRETLPTSKAFPLAGTTCSKKICIRCPSRMLQQTPYMLKTIIQKQSFSIMCIIKIGKTTGRPMQKSKHGYQSKPRDSKIPPHEPIIDSNNLLAESTHYMYRYTHRNPALFRVRDQNISMKMKNRSSTGITR